MSSMHTSHEPSYLHAYVAEGVATFFINFVIQNSHRLANGIFAMAGTYFVAVYISIQISGAHLNGAVTITTFLLDLYKNKREPTRKYYMYAVSQIIGGTLAGLVTMTYAGSDALVELEYAKGTNSSAAFLLELIYTTLLCLVMCAANDNNYHLNDPALVGLLMAGVIFMAHATIGNRTGGVINPSNALSLVLSRLIATRDVNEIHKCMKYILSSCSGAYGAFLIYKIFMYPVYEELRRRRKASRESEYEAFPRRFDISYQPPTLHLRETH